MWALLARVLGPAAAKKIGMRTATEVFKRYGAKTLRQFAKEVDLADLANMSADDILQKAAEVAQKVTLTPSNAKKFAAVVNRRIDSIEQVGRRWATRKIVATGAQQVGIQPPGMLAGYTTRSKAGQFFVNNILSPIVLPTTKGASFGSGYLRGLTGETLSRAVNRLIEVAIGMPRSALNTPKYRAFIRTVLGEIRYLRSIGDIGNARKLYNAVKMGMNASQQVYPQSPHLLRYSLAGNLAGRGTIALGVDFVFIEDEEREQRIETFKQSLVPFVQHQGRVYVDAYTKSDGTRVKGHYRQPRKPQHVSAYNRNGTPVGAYYRNTP